MSIILPRYQTTLLSGARLNRNHGLARGLLFYLSSYGDGVGPMCDLARPGRTSNLPTWFTVSYLLGNAARDFAFDGPQTNDLNFPHQSYSVGAFFREHTAPVGTMIIFGRTTWSLEAHGVETGPDHKFKFVFGGSNIKTVTNNSVGDHLLVATFRDDGATSTVTLYLDGAQEATTVAGFGDASNDTVGVRNVSDGTGSAPLYAGYVWDRALSADEVLELYRNPYAMMYRPKPVWLGDFQPPAPAPDNVAAWACPSPPPYFPPPPEPAPF